MSAKYGQAKRRTLTPIECRELGLGCVPTVIAVRNNLRYITDDLAFTSR